MRLAGIDRSDADRSIAQFALIGKRGVHTWRRGTELEERAGERQDRRQNGGLVQPLYDRLHRATRGQRGGRTFR